MTKKQTVEINLEKLPLECFDHVHFSPNEAEALWEIAADSDAAPVPHLASV